MSPTITSVSPTSGPTLGTNSVIITGTGFSGPATVRFGTTATTFTIDSATQITAISPGGTGTVQVTVTNAAGTSNGVSYTFLGAPTLTSVSPNQGPTSGATTVILTGTGLAGATAVSFGAVAATSFTVNSATQITAVAPAGTGAVQVTVTAPAGVSNGVSYTYLAAPALASVSPNQGPTSGATTVTLTGTGLAGATAVRFGAVAATSFTVNSATQITATAPAGSGVVQVTVTTPGGVSNGVAYTYVAVPTLVSVSPSQGPTSGATTVILTGTGLAGATAVSFGAVAATSFTVNSATQITAVAPAGTGAVQVTVTAPAGVSNGVSYTYLAAPALASVSPNQGPTSGATTVTLTGTGLAGATAVRFGAVAATSFTVNSATQITATAPAGSGVVQVTVTTPGGVSNGVAYTYVAVPTLVSVSPSQGPTSGATTVILTGTGLAGATAVSFGAVAATSFTVNSATQITATAPAGSGVVQVTVTTPGGVSNGVAYTYSAAPALVSVSPSQGPTSGATTVTLTGTGLAGATAVSFGAAPASFTVVSPTQITAVAPAGSGAVQVTVTTPGGVSNGVAYTYLAAPTLTSVSPNQGPISGATTVTLTGTGLAGATAVSFGAVAATSFTVNSPTQITATAPAGGAGTVDVSVTTPGGTITLPSSYFYMGAPALTGVSPGSGPLTGANTVTVTGTQLTGTTAVGFGATAASAFTVVSDTQITATAPPGTTGTVAVTATTPGGVSNAVSYTYLATPAITALTPDQGPTSGGNMVTITGTALAQTSAVLFGATAAAFTVISDIQIVANAPAGTSGPVAVGVTTPGGISATATYTRIAPPTI